MRVVVDYDCCDSNGLCADVAPEIFELDDHDELQVRQEEVPRELWRSAEDAALACPKLAITLVESS